MKQAFVNFLKDVKFFLSIYTWIETWCIIGSAVAITFSWSVVSYALSLPNPWRSIIIWSLILSLAALVPKVITSLPKNE